MADALKLRIVCVFYHVELADFSAADGGLGPLDGLNIVNPNNIDSYFKALSKRVRAQ